MRSFAKRFVALLLMPVFMMFATVDSLYAQQSPKSIRGSVKDTNGLPVVGATVIQSGTNNGVITDKNGAFTLSLVGGKTPAFDVSCIGFQTQTLQIGNRTWFDVILEEEAVKVEEVTVVAYGVQKKETVTGAISSVGTEQLLVSPNANVANALAGQLNGISTVQSSGQPGMEDPEIYVRGVGSLNDSSPLILVDGVEMSFTQLDPNEIEKITVLKDASATAVFGVRGANGVILVTTRRGTEGKMKISFSSSVGLTRPTRMLEMANSYETALRYNEMEINDGKKLSELSFSPYAIEAFRTHSDPIMYPDMDWNEYLYKDVSVQTQHNVNVSGGTSRVRYFVSLGMLYQDGMMKELPGLDYDGNYSYTRYNFRTNLDIDVTKTTRIKLTLGGIIGNTSQPIGGSNGTWSALSQSQPFSSPGIIDGKLMNCDERYFGSMRLISALAAFYGHGYQKNIRNTMNMNLELSQQLNFITEGLSFQVKGAYNTTYNFIKKRTSSTETWTPYYTSSIDGSGLNPGDEGFNYDILYRVSGKDAELGYAESSNKDRDWYLEASLRYERQFGGRHNVSALLLYNQSKNYYPEQYVGQPSAYVGIVGRVTYNYDTKYLFEFNAGYNGSENFAPGKTRYGFFPAVSAGWILTQEDFMKNQRVFDYLKIRATFGLVGNDNMKKNRYLYLPSAYTLKKNGYNFGIDTPENAFRAVEGRIGNPDVTWETAYKQNYGIEAAFLNNRLKLTFDYFREYRNNILIQRNTIPAVVSLGSTIVPVVNMGEVRNTGFEVELRWNHTVGKFNYWIQPNVSFARNTILFMDEVEPNEPYMAETGRSIGMIYGYEAVGFYNDSDFNPDGSLVAGLPDPGVVVYPGDVKYLDKNGDGVINADDESFIGYPTRPELTFGFNYGIRYKGFDLTMNWSGAANRSVLLKEQYRQPFGATASRALPMYMAQERWTPSRADVATMPRFSQNSKAHNYKDSSLWVRDASYVRLKTVKIGYTFQGRGFLRSLGISSLNVYMSAYNLLTFDTLDYIDPEQKPNSQEIDYPITQTYNLGLTVNF